MPVDRNSPVHLYIQIAENIRQRVAEGEFSVGALPSESKLCKLYGVSRFPMRQAMALLVKEGLISRSRGKGTFASGRLKSQAVGCPSVRRMITLVLPGLKSDFSVDILNGFEHAAAEAGYTASVAFSAGAASEAACIERAVAGGSAGIVIFPVDDSPIDETFLNDLTSRGIYVSIIDRSPGLDHIDYIGSDNSGGGYLAARHMSLHGYSSAIFVAETIGVSSVQERFSGFRRGLQQLGMRLINAPGECTESDPQGMGQCGLSCFSTRLECHLDQVPFAVFTENDGLAETAIKLLKEHGYVVGTEVGVVGFDNLTIDEYLSPSLTSVAQNGFLIGETAAALAVQKIETGSRQSVRHILPTQLIARQSCGENRGGI